MTDKQTDIDTLIAELRRVCPADRCSECQANSHAAADMLEYAFTICVNAAEGYTEGRDQARALFGEVLRDELNRLAKQHVNSTTNNTTERE